MDAFSIGIRAPAHLTGPAAIDRLGGLVERLAQHGCDAFYLAGASRAGGGELEPFVVLGSLVERSGDLELGELPSTLGRRSPSLVSKLVSSLDALSGGRAFAVLGEADRLSGEAHTLAELHESVEIVRAMLRVRGPSLSGTHFEIEGAFNEPATAGDEPVPLGLLIGARSWEAGSGEEARGLDLLELAARFCERCVVALDPSRDARAIRNGFTDRLVRSGRLVREARLVGLVRLGGERAARTARQALVAHGYAGVVLDWSGEDEQSLFAALDGLRD